MSESSVPHLITPRERVSATGTPIKVLRRLVSGLFEPSNSSTPRSATDSSTSLILERMSSLTGEGIPSHAGCAKTSLEDLTYLAVRRGNRRLKWIERLKHLTGQA